MKYSENLTKEIVAELEKVPIIRNACLKFGIDHSTFYRWMIRYPTFLMEVTNALFLGRQRYCDTAESVIISGIQNKDYKCSAFYLTHNHPQYMSAEKGKYHFNLNRAIANFSPSSLPKDSMTFEKIFEQLYMFEKNFGVKFANEGMRPLVEIFCNDDLKLVDIFYASYSEWKNDKNSLEKKIKEAGCEDLEE